MRKKYKVRNIKISYKIALVLLIFGLVIAVSAVLIGRQVFKDNIQRIYNDQAYQIAEVSEGYFDSEDIELYSDLVLRYARGEADDAEIEKSRNDVRYRNICEALKKLRASMQVNDVYICAVDDEAIRKAAPDAQRIHGIIYIADSYIEEEKSFPLGYTGDFNGTFAKTVLEIYDTGVRSKDYFISESEFGYNTSAVYPVVRNGKTVAMIGVEQPMSMLQSTISYFTWQTILITSLVFVVILVLILVFARRSVSGPIMKMADAMDNYITERESEQAGEDSLIEKLEIKTGDELEVLCSSLKEMEGDLVRHIENLKQVTAEKERIGAELNVATQIQADMLPRIFPPFPDKKEFELFASMDPAKEVGGDFYDFFMIDDDHLGLVMADVSGKGVPAALFMVISKTMIKNRALAGNYSGPGEVLSDVNEQLCDGNDASLFVTVWFGILTISTGHIVFSSAGHEYPAFCRNGEGFRLERDKHGMALAVMEGVKVRETETYLKPGETLFIYTDGVPEATNSNDELFGEERMVEALRKHETKDMSELLRGVRAEIDEFVGDAPQFDDLTMLGLYYRGSGQE